MASHSASVERALEAYGGEDRWRSAHRLEAHLWAWGMAFRLRWTSPLRDATLDLAVRRPLLRLSPPDWGGMSGVLDGQAVRLEDGAGRLVSERENGRAPLHRGRRALWWDRLDQTYFAGYSLWNSLVFPALLLRRDIEWKELEPGVLEARFPPDLPTHSTTQRFYLDRDSGLLLRHEYVVEVLGGWARAAGKILEHGSWDELPFPSRQRVALRLPGGRTLPAPLLLGVEISRWRLS